MFALAALVLFILAAFGVRFDAVNIVYLAAACIAAHLLLGSVISLPRFNRTNRD